MSTRGPVRLVATDLDGTLLRSDGTVSDRTRAALQAATAQGLLVAFVTGRPPRWLDVVVDETGHVGVAVGANGAVLYDMATEEVLVAHTLEPELLTELGARLRADFPGRRVRRRVRARVRGRAGLRPRLADQPGPRPPGPAASRRPASASSPRSSPSRR